MTLSGGTEMERRLGIGVVAIALLGVGLAAFAAWWDRPLLVSEATSPDGTWGVAVVGHRLLSGDHELTAEVRDARGNAVPGGASVIGIAPSGSDMRGYAVTFDDPETARIGGASTIRKSGHFPAK